MKSSYNNKSISTHMVIVLLLVSIVCVSINATGSGRRADSAVTIKKPASASKSDTQVPEKVESESESENDHKPHISFFYIHAVAETLNFDISRSKHICQFNTTRLHDTSSTVPLYLVKRSIMI